MSTFDKTQSPDTVTILFYRNQFKDPDVFDELLDILGKNPNDPSVVITITPTSSPP